MGDSLSHLDDLLLKAKSPDFVITKQNIQQTFPNEQIVAEVPKKLIFPLFTIRKNTYKVPEMVIFHISVAR